MAKVCRHRLAQQLTEKKQTTKQQRRGANWVHRDSQDSKDGSDQDLPLYQVSNKSLHPITVDLEINKKKLTMEIDTGAAVSIISEKTRKKIFPNAVLSKSSVLLKTYTGEPMPVLGEMNVEVKYGSQILILTLTVIEGSGPSLFGRDWLVQLRLDWKTIGLAMLSDHNTQIEVLKKKYDQVFSAGLGTMLHFKASLNVKPEVKPIFFRPRSIPFAIKETIERS